MEHFSRLWLLVSGRVILIAVLYGPGLLSEVAEFQIFDTAPSDALNCRKTELNKWPCKHERCDGSLVSYTRIRQHGEHAIKYRKVTRIFMAETMVRNLNLFVFDLYSFCIPNTYSNFHVCFGAHFFVCVVHDIFHPYHFAFLYSTCSETNAHEIWGTSTRDTK